MKLQTKLTLALGVVLITGFGLTGVSGYRQIQDQHLQHALEKAEAMSGLLMAMRRVYQNIFLNSALPLDEKYLPFLPAHAISRISADFGNWNKAGLSFNNVSDRPRNPANQADAVELEAIDWFRSNPLESKRMVLIKKGDGTKYYHYTTPIWIEAYCLKCHGERAAAPAVVRDNYLTAFDYHLGDLRGILSIKIPESEVSLASMRQFYQQLAWQGLVLLIAFGLGVLLMRKLVIARLAEIQAVTHQFADGDLSARVTVRHQDEISQVGFAFNQMAEQRQQAESKQREQEQQIRDLLDSIDEAVYGIDTNGICIFANTACAKMLGYAAPNELIGHDLHPLIYHTKTDGSSRLTNSRVFDSLRKGIPQRLVEDVFWRKDGSSFPVEYSSHAMYRDGVIKGAVVAFNDISHRLRTEESLRQVQKMQAIGQLTGGIAHDFNNVLAILLGSLDLLKSDLAENEKAIQRVKVAQQVAWRAADLTKQLLQFARQEPRQVALVDLNRVLSEMEQLLDRSLTPEIHMGLQLGPDLWLIEVDEGDLRDSVLNMLFNAKDAMPKGGKLTLATENLHLESGSAFAGAPPTAGDYVRFSIQDTGEGMDREQLERIFEPFYTTKPRGKGTGLGMAMVYAFVLRSKGHIAVSSEVGLGTEISVYLPAKPGARQETQAAAQPIADRVFHASVLLVDDEPQLLDIGLVSLSKLGLNVITANSGQEALAILESGETFDLLITDMIMAGGMNGDELADRARAVQPDLKLMFVTGYTDDALVNKASSHWHAPILAKPYSQQDLIKCLEQVLTSEPK